MLVRQGWTRVYPTTAAITNSDQGWTCARNGNKNGWKCLDKTSKSAIKWCAISLQYYVFIHLLTSFHLSIDISLQNMLLVLYFSSFLPSVHFSFPGCIPDESTPSRCALKSLNFHLIHCPKNQRPALHIWKGLEIWLNLELHLYSLCMYGWYDILYIIYNDEIRNPPNMILDMVSVQRAKQGSLMWLLNNNPIWTSNVNFIKYLKFWGGPCHDFKWEASTSATCNVKLRKATSFVKSLDGKDAERKAISGALVKGPKGNWRWTWSKKVRKNT